jgi:hypothetical protein
MTRTTHLEIVSKDQWVRRARPGTGLDIRECVVKQPRFNRFLYEYVGRDWKWVDRLVWPEPQWQDYAAADNLRTFVAYREGSIAGYYELKRTADGSVEIRIFGLAPEFVGRDLAGRCSTARSRTPSPGMRTGSGCTPATTTIPTP